MIQHIAGPVENGVQRCTRCLKVLHDGRNMKTADGASLSHVGFTVGNLYTDGIVTTVYEPADWTPCAREGDR